MPAHKIPMTVSLRRVHLLSSGAPEAQDQYLKG